MNLDERTTQLGGFFLILLAVCLVLALVLSLSVGDADVFKREEVEQAVLDLHDNRGLWIASNAVFISLDAVVALVVAPLLYLLFRDRARLLSLIVLVAFIGQSAVSAVVDSVDASLVVLASDYVEGGPGLDAGDAVMLEIARTMAVATSVLGQTSFTMLGLALVALGLLIALAPEGAVNPPRWLGWVSVVAGVAAWLAWGIVLTEAAFVFFPIQALSSLVLLIGLGIHLLRLEPTAAPATTA
jgi:hypothetical protein